MVHLSAAVILLFLPYRDKKWKIRPTSTVPFFVKNGMKCIDWFSPKKDSQSDQISSSVRSKILLSERKEYTTWLRTSATRKKRVAHGSTFSLKANALIFPIAPPSSTLTNHPSTKLWHMWTSTLCLWSSMKTKVQRSPQARMSTWLLTTLKKVKINFATGILFSYLSWNRTTRRYWLQLCSKQCFVSSRSCPLMCNMKLM